MKKTFLLLATAIALAGCQKMDYQSPTGEKFSRTSLGNKVTISELSVVGDTNGVRTLKLKGYKNDQVEAIGAMAEGLARGLSNGKK